MFESIWLHGSAPGGREPGHRRTYDAMVVSRVLDARPERLAGLVGVRCGLPEALPDGSILVVGPLTPSPGLVGTTWRGRASIRRTGVRPFRQVRVDVEITDWGPGTSELRISPTSHRVPRWGARRFDRYFALVHAAADHLRTTLHGAQADAAASPCLVVDGPTSSVWRRSPRRSGVRAPTRLDISGDVRGA